MQQNGMFYINYDGCNTAELYGVGSETVKEISETISTIVVEMLENIYEYSWYSDGKAGFHKGKILQRIFKEITEFQHRIIVISFIDALIGNMGETLQQEVLKRS